MYLILQINLMFLPYKSDKPENCELHGSRYSMSNCVFEAAFEVTRAHKGHLSKLYCLLFAGCSERMQMFPNIPPGEISRYITSYIHQVVPLNVTISRNTLQRCEEAGINAFHKW